MHDDDMIGSSSNARDESETKQRMPVQRPGTDDVESSIVLSDLRIHVDEDGRVEGEDKELAQLQSELDAAKARHAKAEQDVHNPGWGRWAKYVFVTATEKASTVESSDFTVSRIALFGAVGLAGSAVAYLLPALDMSQIQSTDLATNTTSPDQQLTDHANVVYYWGNAAAIGFTSIATFIGGLAGIRKSYKAMRERILAQAALQRDQAQADYDKYVKYTARLKEMRGKCDAAEKSRDAAMALALRSGEKVEAALAQVVKLEQALGSANTKSVMLGEELRRSREDTQEEQDRARGLESEIERLKLGLVEARADSQSIREQADKQRREADELDRRLGEARREVEKQALRIKALELETDTSKRVVSMLETAITKIDQADEKIQNVSTKVNQLSEQAQAEVSVSSKETKD